jgi:hypothetical protein
MGRPEFLPSDAKALLLTVLDEEHLEGLVQLRRAKRAPLSMIAVRRLLKQWEQHPPGANDAVEIMAVRGWQAFDVAWLPGQQRAMGPAGNSREARKAELRGQVAASFDFGPAPRRLQ